MLGVAGMGQSESSRGERRNVSVIAGTLSCSRCWWLSLYKCMTLVIGRCDVVTRHADDSELELA
jgi:hypothetical protein